MELKEIARYNSILSAISSGKHTFKEISDYSGIETSNISYYIDNLSRLLDLTVATDPVGGKKKSGRYAIKDNFFRFWYRFIFRNHASLEVSTTDMVMNIIMKHLNNYLAFAFEDIVRELFVHYNGGTIKGHSIKFSTIGAWWNRTGDEIDICALGDGKMYLGEVKWTNRQVGCNVARQLVKKSEMVSGIGERISMLVSGTGFTDKCIRYMYENNWIYLDMKDITALYQQS